MARMCALALLIEAGATPGEGDRGTDTLSPGMGELRYLGYPT